MGHYFSFFALQIVLGVKLPLKYSRLSFSQEFVTITQATITMIVVNPNGMVSPVSKIRHYWEHVCSHLYDLKIKIKR